MGLKEILQMGLALGAMSLDGSQRKYFGCRSYHDTLNRKTYVIKGRPILAVNIQAAEDINARIERDKKRRQIRDYKRAQSLKK